MLTLERHHDFQQFLSPTNGKVASVNPPSFNWPQKQYKQTYVLELVQLETNENWEWEGVSSPFQLSFTLPLGSFRWRVTDNQGMKSEWLYFDVDSSSEHYLPPTANQLFESCANKQQFLLYFDDDLEAIARVASAERDIFIETTKAVDIRAVQYPDHYRRGMEEGKRTAIANVRNWIDRDLIGLTLLYRVWGDESAGQKALQLFLKICEWSPEGPASLLRPCTWGDEVGLSLARNMFLAYHWLSPLMETSEKQFARPMLVRIAYQMEERLEQDMFKQYPGHSHTSRLPSYLGLAALALHKEYDRAICTRWLDYALMTYRGVLPFYGGDDGSWAEGPFYSSSYTKWHHPFFLAVERLSGFSFYNHPFYKNYCQFAMDFVATDNQIHPFGDGFWCKREGKEWPGFFAQNPLRIYADRFGGADAKAKCYELERDIVTYKLHLLDVVPTIPQLAYQGEREAVKTLSKPADTQVHRYYPFAGFGKLDFEDQSLLYRASQFGNSSHRHGDQGGFALFDNGLNVLTPTGSYGYRFGSTHHKEWTRTSLAHNVPLIGSKGQLLDDESTTAKLTKQFGDENIGIVTIDLSQCYEHTSSFNRTLVNIKDVGLVIIDEIDMTSPACVDWRLHSACQCVNVENGVELHNSQYRLALLSHCDVQCTISSGYEQETSPSDAIVSDANDEVYHLEWSLPKAEKQWVIATCMPPQVECKLIDSQLTLSVADKQLNIDCLSGEFEVVNLAKEMVLT